MSCARAQRAWASAGQALLGRSRRISTSEVAAGRSATSRWRAACAHGRPGVRAQWPCVLAAVGPDGELPARRPRLDAGRKEDCRAAQGAAGVEAQEHAAWMRSAGHGARHGGARSHAQAHGRGLRASVGGTDGDGDRCGRGVQERRRDLGRPRPARAGGDRLTVDPVGRGAQEALRALDAQAERGVGRDQSYRSEQQGHALPGDDECSPRKVAQNRGTAPGLPPAAIAPAVSWPGGSGSSSAVQRMSWVACAPAVSVAAGGSSTRKR